MKIFLHRSFTAIAAATLWAITQAIAAQAPSSQAPSSRDVSRLSPAGSYLAARQANLDRDPDAAATYYRAALRSDQRNPELLELTFYSLLAYGEINEAVRLAERLVQLDRLLSVHEHRAVKVTQIAGRPGLRQQNAERRQHLLLDSGCVLGRELQLVQWITKSRADAYRVQQRIGGRPGALMRFSRYADETVIERHLGLQARRAGQPH